MIAIGSHCAGITHGSVHGFSTSYKLDFRLKAKRRLAFESSHTPRKSAIAGLIILSDLEFALGNSGLVVQFTSTALR